jgi:hypothetical protein
MPVTGTYDASKLVIGPGKMYLNAPLPAAGASLSTVLTGGVPASGTLVGYTKTGTEYHSSVDQEGYEVDETKSPIFTNLTGENVSITGTLVQLVDVEVLKGLLPNYNFVTPGTFTVGGLVAYAATAQPSVLVVGQDRAVPSKIVAFMLYKAINIGEFILQITRANPSETDFEFSGQAIGSRTAGDQVGQVWFESAV